MSTVILLRLFLSFLKIGLFSFGGGYAMLPLIEKEIVLEHRWITHAGFVDIIAVAEITPGPIAVNSATFVGYTVAGLAGSISATVAVVLGPIVLIVVLMCLARRFASTWLARGALDGLRPAVLALIAYSAVSVGRVSLTGVWTAVLAAAAFAVLVFTKIHPLLVLLAAAVAGGLFLYG